jgi:chromate transporter
VPLLRRSRMAAAFLDGVKVTAQALMAAVTAELGKAALVDRYTIAIALLSAALLLRFRINSVWLIGAGAICGIIVQRI